MKTHSYLSIVVLFPAFILLFLILPAGTVKYWEAWVYAIAIFIPLIITVIYLQKNDPALLERRMRFREKEDAQKAIVRLTRLPFILAFIIPGLDHRFGWSDISASWILSANILVMLGYFGVFLVFRENTYTSRIVEVEENQKVISTGPYALVRHPMYTGIMVMFLATPVALGSWWAYTVFAFVPFILIYRLIKEEQVLLRDLPGYQEYCQKTRYRLIPFLW